MSVFIYLSDIATLDLMTRAAENIHNNLGGWKYKKGFKA